MLLVLFLLSSSGFALREGVLINRRARQRLPQRQQVIKEPFLVPVQPAQDAFQGSYEEKYELTPYQRTRQAENVKPYREPDYKQLALAVFNQQSFGSRQYLPQVCSFQNRSDLLLSELND